jgi:hypothetical protein
MNFLLLAKLMNKVLLTSLLFNSLSPAVHFPEPRKRLNKSIGIQVHFFDCLKTGYRVRNA